MSLTAEQYRDQLMALAPSGRALPTDTDSLWGLLLLALADELTRVDGRADDLMDEADPRTALEMLADWERVCGLPSDCAQDAETIQARRQACALTLAAQGGQNIAYFVALAETLGVTASVQEFRPFRAGAASAGDALTNGDWMFAWVLRSPETTVQTFEAGGNSAGDALATWGNALFECRMSRLAPAHTILIFAYGEE